MTRLFPEDKRQRIRMERFLLSASAYALCVPIAWIAKGANMTSLSVGTLLFGTLAILVYLIGMYFVYRTGFNQRFDDENVTRLQMLVAIGWISLFIGSTTELRGAMLMIYLFVAMFSLFTFTPRQTATVGMFISAVYGLVIATDWWMAAPDFNLTAALIEWGILTVALGWLLAITSYLSGVRAKIKYANDMIRQQSEEIRRSNLQLETALERVKQLVVTDELTGLGNRRHFVDAVNAHVKKCRDGRFGFGLCVVDLDHFKKINDNYGHLIGDQVLRAAAKAMQAQTREYDLLARCGGEEFSLIVTRGDESITLGCAERLRNAVAATEIEVPGQTLRLTASIGATVFRHGDSVQGALARADEAMYAAKRAGRNQVILHTDTRESALDG